MQDHVVPCLLDADDAAVAFDVRFGEEVEESDEEANRLPVVDVEEEEVDFDLTQLIEGDDRERIAAGGGDGVDECALCVHDGRGFCVHLLGRGKDAKAVGNQLSRVAIETVSILTRLGGPRCYLRRRIY